MKKVLAILLALAMSASATMMAFAEDYDEDDAVVGTDTTVIEEAGTADTSVDILVNSTNINVTVPLKYAIVADVAGGSCITPEDDTYYIQNNSAIAVEVTEAKIEDKNVQAWLLVENPITNPTYPTTSENELYMSLTPSTGAVWNLYNTYAADVTATANWTIGAATTADGTKLTFDITASSSMLNTTEDAPAQYVITYTFAAA